MQNPTMFNKAKNESEILFTNALLSIYDSVIVPEYGNIKFESVIHVDESMRILDCEYHIDVLANAINESNGTH